MSIIRHSNYSHLYYSCRPLDIETLVLSYSFITDYLKNLYSVYSLLINRIILLDSWLEQWIKSVLPPA